MRGVIAIPMAATGHGGEVNLVLPDLGSVHLPGGLTGRTLLATGLVVCLLGLLFAASAYRQLRALPVHRSMRDVSELI